MRPPAACAGGDGLPSNDADVIGEVRENLHAGGFDRPVDVPYPGGVPVGVEVFTDTSVGIARRGHEGSAWLARILVELVWMQKLTQASGVGVVVLTA